MKRSTFRVDFAGENIAGVILPIYTLKEFEDAGSNLSLSLKNEKKYEQIAI